MGNGSFKLRPSALVAPLAVGVGMGLGIVLGASAVALSPAAASAVNAAVAAVTSCSSTSACLGAVNASSGPGIEGTSTSGYGVKGTSTTSYGVVGTSKSGVGIQAVSASANALYAANNTSRSTIDAVQNGSGPAITATAGAGPAVNGKSTSGPGVSGTSTSGAGVSGTSAATFAAGVAGTAANGYGVRGSGGFGGYFVGSSFDGVLGSTSTTGYAGVAGADHSTDGGYGVYGSSDTGSAGTFFQTHGNTQTALAVYGGTVAGIGSLLLDVRSSDDNGSLNLDDSGNLTVTGLVTTGGSCSSGCIASRVRSYAPREAEPTMEDVGRGHLVFGSAYVTLDPAFANVVDAKADYSVLITPEGDSNGVFIAQRTRQGFVVRENRGGRSSLGFSYRIVAKPFGSNAPRLPMIALRAHPRTVPQARALMLVGNSPLR